MKQFHFVIPWKSGLHLGPASRLVRLAKASKSVISLQVGERVADARSILAVLLLCAASGMVINFQVAGEDEDAVLSSITGLFDYDGPGNDSNSGQLKS